VTETLQVGELVFEVRRSERRKTLALTVDRRGELVAHVPSSASADEVTKWINRKLLWVYSKLALKREAVPQMRSPEYISGEAFSYLGRRFRLKIVASQPDPLRFDGTQFTLRRDARPAEDHFRRWYIQLGTAWLIPDEGGDFKLTTRQREVVDSLLAESDSLRCFLKDRVIADPYGDVTVTELVEAYGAYCPERRWHPLPITEVYNKLEGLMLELFGVTKSHSVERGSKNQRGFHRVKLKAI
jgi:hypothetical protein